MAEIWERQKGERDASYIYFSIYLHELKHTPKKLQDVINYIESLENDGDLRVYKSDLIEVPTLRQIQKLSQNWNWHDRDVAYTNHLARLDEEARQEQFAKDNDTIIEAIQEGLKYNKKLRKQLNHSEYAESTKINLNYTLSRELDLLNKNLRLSVGKPINISKSEQDVNLDAEVEYTGLSELFEAFNEGKKQYHKKLTKE
ncbi:MAG: hypothetical protein J6Y78_06255 [Paludibacteraceae bacterium]|nr:hypothetical protein [Paludibacteraceae bacterium]